MILLRLPFNISEHCKQIEFPIDDGILCITNTVEKKISVPLLFKKQGIRISQKNNAGICDSRKYVARF